jgi:hypothetical protein
MSYNVYDSRGFRGQVASNHGLGLLYDYLTGKGVDDLVDDGSAELDGDFLARLDKVAAPKDKAVASTLARLKELAHECRDVVIISDGVGIDEEAEKALKPDYADTLRKRLEGALAADMETALKKAFALLKERVLTEAGVKSHSESRCMAAGCEKAPDVRVVWADGRARAWFCEADYRAWRQASERDVVKEEWLNEKGGPGSGHFGHAGRPGQVGGGVPDEERRGRMPKFPKLRTRPDVAISANDNPSARRSAETVRQKLEAIPNHHLVHIEGIYVNSGIVDAIEDRNGYRRGAYAGFYSRTAAHDSGYITVRDYASDTLEHEVGHHVWYEYEDKISPISSRVYAGAVKRGHGISTYGMTNEKEYFAEWYEGYARMRRRSGSSFGENDRAHLQKLDPEMFTLMKELWHDK